MDLGLRKRRALVCAASRGLGRAIARELALEGAAVAICARSRDPLAEAAEQIAAETGARVVPIVADVASSAGCAALADAARAALGGIDILVTNTGGPAPGSFDRCEDPAWEAAFHSTLMNVVRLVRRVAPEMRARRWGRIVNVTSTTARQPFAGLTMSNALRPAILGLAKDLADELGPHGILVNNVCPGMHQTDRVLHLAQARGADPESYFAERTAALPLRRMGRPEELAAAVAFLCSERASYITGTSLVVDGGACRGL